MLTARHWIDALGLEAHVEGGYFRRTFQADHRPPIRTPEGDRYTLTSIHYLLTHWSPVGHWHLNRSDILHFHHHGEPVTYHLLHPDGSHSTTVLGQDPRQGQHLTVAVPGGVWKASHLASGDHALISEAVAPGFDYADMTLGRADELIARHPAHAELIRRYCRPTHPDQPGPAIEVRRAGPPDGDALGEIHAEAWKAAYAPFFAPGFAARAVLDRRGRWHARVTAGPETALLASLDGRPLALSFFGPSADRPGLVELHSFYSHPDGWGSGIAAALMDTTLRHIGEQGAAGVHLWTLRDTPRSRRFYTKSGFAETGGTRLHDFGDGNPLRQVEYERALA